MNSDAPDRAIRVVAAWLTDEQGRVLAAQRSRAKHLGGLWELPGGKVETGETDQSALRREMLEELNVSVNIGGQLDSVRHRYERTTVELVVYRCTILSGVLEANEHEDLRWIRPRDFQMLDWAPADVPILERFVRTEGPSGS